jgi:phosphoribosylamine--glycine ligase
MKVLVIGSGGREHALVWKLQQSQHVSEIFCTGSNGGIARSASCVAIDPESIDELADFADNIGIDLTVVGPEVPLSMGIVDVFRSRGLCIFGPDKLAARLEASKIFSKEFMRRHDIPTAAFDTCSTMEEAEAALKSDKFGYPVVLKADGLAAGKGVIIAQNEAEALAAASEMLEDHRFGKAGDRILIEKCLVGEEVSFMVISDGKKFLPLVPARDHKRAFDNDEGPNTGGMGVFAPAGDLDPATFRTILTKIVSPTINGMQAEETPFQGVLYCGLMLTEDGPQVLEYNARFGDPETQVVLPLLQADLYEILKLAADGQLTIDTPLELAGAAVTVVMAAEGYPGSYEKGMKIEGLETVAAQEDIIVFHAGTAQDGADVVTTGGRVLSVTAIGETLEQATARAYEGVEMIKFDGAFYRTDIAKKSIKG